MSNVRPDPVVLMWPRGSYDPVVLKDVFGEIIIADAVYNEIKAKQGYGYNEIDTDFIKIQR